MLAVLAVDLGATSIRVARVDLDEVPPRVEIIHRYPHEPQLDAAGSLRWRWKEIVTEVRRGLELALARGPVASIGVDAWGVDYGLLSDDGELLSAPYSYRDLRTTDWHTAVDQIGAARLYQITGIQLMQINTLFQLAAHDPSELARARHLLMLPELLIFELTGAVVGEYTTAGTTGMLDIHRRTWSASLADAIGIDRSLLPPLIQAGAPVGRWRGTPIHLVAGHDTQSAVVATTLDSVSGCFVSSGTWVLVGRELPGPNTSAGARAANFSNEAAPFGGVNFLRNVTGFWIFERCWTAWGRPSLEELLSSAARVAPTPLFDTQDPRFLAPADMEREVRDAAELSVRAPRSAVTRCIVESIACSTARAVGELEAVTGSAVNEIGVVGGGARNALFLRLLQQHAGLRVRPGDPEAAALGNALVQGIALGRFTGLHEARSAIAAGT